jgi:uncharacterized membrane protein
MRLRTKIFLAFLIGILALDIYYVYSRWQYRGEISYLDAVGGVIIVLATIETIRGESKRSQR